MGRNAKSKLIEAAVITEIVDVTRAGQFLLLETLVSRVAEAILAMDSDIESVTVSVRKRRPPVPEDVATVGVRTHLSRS